MSRILSLLAISSLLACRSPEDAPPKQATNLIPRPDIDYTNEQTDDEESSFVNWTFDESEGSQEES